MEISLGNSGGSRTRSLDLETLYKPKGSEEGGNAKKGKSSGRVENGEGVGKKKRKSRKEVTVSSIEPPKRKKSRKSSDGVEVDGVHSGLGGDSARLSVAGLGQKLNGSGGLSGIGLNLGGAANSILIPKRPRGSVGRNKFAKNNLLKPPGASGSVEKVTKSNDEPKEAPQNPVSCRGEPVDGGAPSVEKVGKLNVDSRGKVRSIRKQKGVVGVKGNQKEEEAAVTSSRHAKREGGDPFDNKDLLKPNGLLSPKEQGAKLNDELKEVPQNQDSGVVEPVKSKSNSTARTAKLNGNSRSKGGTNIKQKGVDGLKGNQKRKEGLALVGPSPHGKSEGGLPVVNNEDPSSKRSQSNRRKRKVLGSGGETVSRNSEPSVDKKVSTCDIDPDDDLEQNAARMLSSRFDPSCTGFASKNRTSALSSENGMSLLAHPAGNTGSDSPVAVPNPASADAADRVLRPRKEQKGKGASRKRRHFYEIHSDDMDAHWFLNRRIKIFWPLDESWYYGLVNDYDAEKDLHHVKYDDRDEEWISLENERFKLLLLPSEVPHKQRNREAALEDTYTEGTSDDTGRIGLHDNEAFMASHMESEPIISWLSRSSLRGRSSPSVSLKKQKVMHSPPEPSSLSDKFADAYINGDMGLSEREKTCNPAFLDTSSEGRKNEKSVLERTSTSEQLLPIVYFRRRYRKHSDAAHSHGSASGAVASLALPASRFLSSAKHNASLTCLGPVELPWSLSSAGMLELDMAFIESKQFQMCMSQEPILIYVLGADILWLLRRVLLLQYGTIVTMWPTVCLEVLFVDNVVGLRFFLFEGCLKQAVAFILLVMTIFHEPEKYVESLDQQMPATSIRFKLSFFQNFKQKVFSYYSFSKVRDSNWLYLDSEFQPYCLLTKKLSLPECTYDNIKLLEGGNQHLEPPYAGLNTCSEAPHEKSNVGVVPMISVSRSMHRIPRSRPSTIFSLKHGELPTFSLSFTAAPNFFLSLHLRLLMERSLTSFSLQEHDSVHSFDHQGDTCLPYADDCRYVGDHFEIPSECSFECNPAISASKGTGSGSICISPQLGKDSVVVGTDGGLRKSSSHHHILNEEADRTSFYPKDAETCQSEIGNSENCQGNAARSKQIQVCKDHASPAMSCSSNLRGMSVEIPPSGVVDRDCRKTPGAQQVSDMTWNLSDGIICSPNPTGIRSLWLRNRFNSSSSPFGDPLHVWSDGKADFIGNGFGNGPKKPRTQVHYTLPSGGPDLNSKSKGNNQNVPSKRIRKANDKRTSDSSKGPRRNLELVACDANLLINSGDKGWRERGARVFLEVADQNEWKLAVKHNGETRYSYKVHQDLQPGSTNRYNHAMMWKGGKDWALEFPDRSQWILFKEMHEECHNRNIRAASIKNIPIPGVRVIEESDDDTEEVPFIRSPRYFRQVATDVELAMDTSHVLYDMDSDDEEWIVRNRATWKTQGKEGDMISDELFEKTIDMLEKLSYAQQRDHFSAEEIEDLIGGFSPVEVTKAIYEHWREKRRQKGMPLIRQLQPPLWERYQQMCKEWEQSKPKFTVGLSTGSQEKASSGDKPPMFAFCLKPRGLELLNKGSKHRPHKKISLSGHSHAFLADHDGHHSSGRRVNGHAFADERAESSDVSPLLAKMYSPRDAAGPGHFSLNGDASDWNHQQKIHRNNSKKIRTVVSSKAVVASSTIRRPGRRNNGKRLNSASPDWQNRPNPHRHPGQLLLGGSDQDEFKLRDASSAARHARNMARLQRERAQKLMLSADLAIHKAVSALLTAEAIRACTEGSRSDRSMKHGDNELMKSTGPPHRR